MGVCPKRLRLWAFLTQWYVKLRSGFTFAARCLVGPVVLGVWPQALALVGIFDAVVCKAA